MLINYFKLAIRNLFKHKLFSFINIFGLALSMSVCMMVLISLKDQLSYDTFHPNSNRLYRVISQLSNKEGATYRFASSPLPLANKLNSDYPFIESTARLYATGNDKAIANKKELSLNAAFTEPAFFRVFGFRLQEGDSATALSQPNSIVLNHSTAAKFFGTANAIGQMVHLQSFGDFIVTGVLDEPKGHSHIDFDSYLSFSSIPALEKSQRLPLTSSEWNANLKAYTYVKLKEGSRQQQLNKALLQVATSVLKNSKLQGKENFELFAQPFDKIILGEELMNSIGNVGSKEKTAASILIAFIVLLSACFNYTNLSIARSLNRGKEVGIRKVAGAFRYQVFLQFILEAVLIAFLALGFAWIMLQNIIANAPFSGELTLQYDNGIFLWFALFALFTGLLAGGIPAWVLSSFKPVEVLKNLNNIKLFGGNSFRKVLIVIQFTLALVTTIFTSVSSGQFSYIANADPGYDRSNVLVIPLNGVDANLATADLRRLSYVRDITATSNTFGRDASGKVLVKTDPLHQPTQMDYFDVDRNMANVLKLKLVAGTTFLETASANKETSVVLNETALRVLNFKNPFEAVGKTVLLNDSTIVQVAGVVKDFHYQTLAVQLGPLVLRNRPSNFNYLLVKTTAADAAIVSAIADSWKVNFPHQPFRSSWLKEDQYERQAAWGTVSMLGFLAFMTVTIACLGLLGMVIFTTETRRKEIGIRKVMGATVTGIISLLSKNFLKLVIIAGLIALPIGYLCSYLFLSIFANHISVGFADLAVSFCALLVLVLITISWQIFKVATANPVHSLRSE